MGLTVHACRVARAARLTPRMVRLTLAGPELAALVSGGPSEYLKLLIPVPGRPLALPRSNAAGGLNYDEASRAQPMRTYTARRFDREALELDVDVLVHRDGAASAWAEAAAPGDRVGVMGLFGPWIASERADWHLLVGDQAALPAIASYLEHLPAGARAVALIEVEDGAEQQPLDLRADARVTWLHRDGLLAGESLLPAALRELAWLSGRPWVRGAGEYRAMRELRRILGEERGLERSDFTVTGYWRHRLTEDDIGQHKRRLWQEGQAAGKSQEELAEALLAI